MLRGYKSLAFDICMTGLVARMLLGMYCYLFRVCITLLLMHYCAAYHSIKNGAVDCWPLAASDKPLSTVDCEGLGLKWIGNPPPSEVERGEPFNLTFQAVATSEFYETVAAFPGYNVTDVREFCSRDCPQDVDSVNRKTCCVWHANIHTCHPLVVQNLSCGSAVCGPWVANDGRLSTHTNRAYGSINEVFSVSDILINFVGVNVVIAHIQVGELHVVIGRTVMVTESRATTVCGDGLCMVGESCNTCSADCCFSVTGVAVGVALPALILLVVSSTIIAVIVCYVHRRRQFYDESWIINYHSLSFTEENNLLSLSSRIKSQSVDDLTVTTSTTSFDRNSRLSAFTDTRIYEGRVVALKKIPTKSFMLTNTVRKEVFQIRQLDHPNICKFIGVTLRDVVLQALVMEYCPKGSLRDVLCNRDIPLNWGFRFSFVSDIAKGLAFLHNRRLYHTRLKSTNCLIDNRWTVKITDFGLPTLRSNEDAGEGAGVFRNKAASIGNLYRMRFRSASVECLTTPDPKRLKVLRIYQAPEVRESKLSQTKLPPQPSTDVYSFGVVLVEVATRIDLLKLDKSELDTSLKPLIDLSDLTNTEPPCPCPHEYLDLIARCWAHSPLSRPTFELVKKTLDRINPTRESPVDMMMVMMEKYSKHLEALVAERTRQLVHEKNKTAKVLHSMLPQSVASDLIHGKPAPATSFSSATIFFSDIVGFTSLASSSSPMEIVNLLNELYTTFDDILDHFDVYKVETIGDAYMVVSGVPRLNDDYHAAEIASMGLQLLSASERFTIPHLPDTKLEIRAGVHTGPVCAGVVGMKMPRYCLFGDTVNTASRMESTSEAMKIQCSSATYQLLKELGGFQLESRGRIAVKGKGYMDTWWITGKVKN